MKSRKVLASLLVLFLLIGTLPGAPTAAAPLESLSTLNGAEATEPSLSDVSESSVLSVVQDDTARRTTLDALHSAPLMFIENAGQFDAGARFQVRGGNTTIYLADDVIWSTVLEEPSSPQSLSLQEGRAIPLPTPEPGSKVGNEGQLRRGVNLKYSFVGANLNPQLEPFNRLDTVVSYFIGDNPAQWQPNVPVWGGVRYLDLYPGVDLEVTGENGQWMWRLVAQDDTDLDAVRLRVEGADILAVDNSGRLRMETSVGSVSGPIVVANLGGSVTTAAYRQILLQAMIEGETVKFLPSAESNASPIESADSDPGELAYSTFLGGSSFDAGNAIAAGSGGTAYVTGETYSTGFPTTPGAFDPTLNGNRDIFVAKLQSNGNALAFSTFLGGGDSDLGYAIAVDTTGVVCIVGSSFSSNFPTTTDAFDTAYNGYGDVVVVKLNPTGSALLYSTYLGGSSGDFGDGLAVDATGATYVTGETRSSNFPTTPDVFDTTWNGGSPYGDAFVAKLNSAGSALEYSTFLGGTNEDDANGIAVDSNGAAYVVGWTGSNDFPTTPGAFDTTFAGGHDVFVTKLNVSASNLVYSGLLGGSRDDQGQAIAIDAFGAVYVTGQTNSSNFTVTPGAYDASLSGTWDGFVAKVSPGGDTLVYSTYLGGSGYDCETIGIDRECVIAADASGVAYIAGRTFSADFPTTSNGFDTNYSGSEDGFMVRLNPNGDGLVYGSFFGGTSGDQTLAVAVDTAGAAYVSGRTYSSDFPTSTGAFDTTYNGGGDAFAIKLLVGGYTSGPVADPDNSTISVQPASLPADGVTAATITVQLLSADGKPAWGKTVLLSSSRGTLDNIVQPTTVTDSNGRTTGIIRSTNVGTATISAWVFDDGVLLSNTASVTFEPYTPPSDAFLFQLNQCVDTATSSLGQIKDDAEAIANDGAYFRGAIGADTAKLATGVIFDMADVISGVNQTYQLQKAARLACPGCYVPGTWNVQFSYDHPAAARLLNIGFMDLEEAPASRISEFIGWGGLQFYAQALDDIVEEVSEAAAKDATQTIFANQDDGMTSVAYPAVKDTANEVASMLDDQRNNLLANLPAMTPDYQREYEDDLSGRTRALLILGQQLDDERMTLANFRQVHGQSNALLNFLLRFTAKSVAKGFLDGPGAVAVGGTLTLFDSYMDGKRLSESAQMYDLATGALLGTPDALRQTYRDACGLNRIILLEPADRAIGQITGVTHHSQGSYWPSLSLPLFWRETASWSEVSLTNTGKSETTFRVLSSYLADTERFGVPWATMHLVEEASITLSPGTSGTVRVDYKRADGTRGFSPRTRTCLPGAGCVPASSVDIQVLGNNEAGTYFIDNDRSTWQPIRLTATGMSALTAVDDLLVIDPPLTAYVLSAPWTQQHEGQLWINNPFTSAVAVTVTQTLPAGVTLLDAGGASHSGDTLTWNTVVEPSALNVVTFTFSFPAIPGTENSLPPATLSLLSPLDGQLLSDNANIATFEAIWPLTVDYATPGYVLPGISSQVVITVTNWLSDSAINGTLAVSVTDAQSATQHTESKPFNVAANGTGVVNFTLPGLPRGDYLVHGQVSTNGASDNAFADRLQVGLPGPLLDYRVSPLGVVYPGDVLTYTLRFTNTIGVPLSGAVVTANLPAGVTVVTGSVTGGGVVEPGQVRWTLGTVGVDQSVVQSFAVQVNADAVPAGGEPGRLFSEPRLTANEIAPTWGPLAWNLVAHRRVFLPLVLKNH